MAFHAEFAWGRGGFLWVSTFFTLSGYLMTTLLVVEHRRRGRIGVRAFWARRFRRLMPTALVTVAPELVAIGRDARERPVTARQTLR